MTEGTLAMLGGEPACRIAELPWPDTRPEDVAAVAAVLGGGVLVADRNVETAVSEFERSWAGFTGARDCIAVSNGTIAIELALRAVGVSRGDEVIVPALSFVATAMAVVNVGAVPVYADIELDTFNLDPDAVEEVITPATRAIVVVHLHGLPCDMFRLREIARKNGLKLIEDAAQAQGARYNGKHCGTFGDAGTFSLQMTKNLPTCGEGGMVVTDDGQIAERLRRLRQFGELIEAGKPRTYRSLTLGTNAKLSAVQAAYSSSQLKRFEVTDVQRKQNVRNFLGLLAELPHLRSPSAPDGYEHAWHILRFGVDQEGPLSDLAARRRRALVMRALVAEGVPVSRYQTMPLPEQPALKSLVTASSGDWTRAARVTDETFVLQKRHLHPEAAPLLEAYARAFEKVFTNLEQLRGLDVK